MSENAGGRGIVVMHPRRYEDSIAIGNTVRDGYAVLVNLAEMQPDAAHQLVDFISGLIFGIEGNIDRVTPWVMLLVPSGITVIDDADNLTGTFFNQF